MRATSFVLVVGCNGDGWTGAEGTPTSELCEDTLTEVSPEGGIDTIGRIPSELPGFDGTPATAELAFVYAERTEALEYWFEPTSEVASWNSCSGEVSRAGNLRVRSAEGTFDEAIEGELRWRSEEGRDFSSFITGYREPCADPCVLAADLQGTYPQQQLASDVEAFADQPADEFPLVAIEFRLFFPGEDVADLPCTVVALLREELTTTMTIATLGERCSSAPPQIVEETWEEAQASSGCNTSSQAGWLSLLAILTAAGLRPRPPAPR